MSEIIPCGPVNPGNPLSPGGPESPGRPLTPGSPFLPGNPEAPARIYLLFQLKAAFLYSVLILIISRKAFQDLAVLKTFFSKFINQPDL